MRSGKIMEEIAISETVSENTEKKRGRPPVMDKTEENIASILTPNVTTRRGKLNSYYRLIAFSVLHDDPRFSWLVDKETEKMKSTILTELGRIYVPEVIKIAALKICELKPRTKEAIALIRSWRTGKKSAGNMYGLNAAIVRAINDYLEMHPGTRQADVEAALLATLESVREEK